MDATEVKQKVLKILDDFGMTGSKAAEAMGVTYATFRNKKNDNAKGHSFNEKNYLDLIEFIKNKTIDLDLRKELTNFAIYLEVPELNSVPKIEEKVNKWLELKKQINI